MRNAIDRIVRGWLTFLLPTLLPAVVLAEPLVLEAPTEAPPPVITPASQPPADAAVNRHILVLPFMANNPADANAWMGKSIQESVVADLTVSSPGNVSAADQAAPNADAAIALAKQRGARYVVAGGFATNNRELRITGQILDTETGKAVGALKVTGDPSEIFHMEDGLAMQIKAQLMPEQAVQQPAPGQAQPPQQQNPQPLPYATQQPAPSDSTGVRNDYGTPPIYSTYATPPVAPVYGADSYYPYADNTVTYPYIYPSYSYAPYCDYGYGCYYPFGLGVGFYGGFDRFHSHFDRNFRHDSAFRGNVGNHSFSGVRSPMVTRGSGSSFRSAASFRSPSISTHSSFGGSHFSGSLHVGSSSFHSSGGSFHGGGGSFHGGGGHSGGHR